MEGFGRKVTVYLQRKKVKRDTQVQYQQLSIKPAPKVQRKPKPPYMERSQSQNLSNGR